MKVVTINGRDYRLRGCLSVRGFRRIQLKQGGPVEDVMVAQLFETLLDGDGNQYPDEDAMLDCIAVQDYAELYAAMTAHIFGEMPKGDGPLATKTNSDTE